MLCAACGHVSAPVHTLLWMSLFKTKVSDGDQDGLKLSDSERSSLEMGEKQRNQGAKVKAEATSRFADLPSFS